jgi:hypothetical protein
MAISFKGAHFPPDIILMGVRWYVAYPLSYRHVEELLEERGVPIDHATIQRWVVKYSPLLEEAFHQRKRPVWVSWRMDETYIKVKGQWYYLYRAVDKTGQTIKPFRGDCLLQLAGERKVGHRPIPACCGAAIPHAAQGSRKYLHRLQIHEETFLNTTP